MSHRVTRCIELTRLDDPPPAPSMTNPAWSPEEFEADAEDDDEIPY
jgi:hypothetical protein